MNHAPPLVRSSVHSQVPIDLGSSSVVDPAREAVRQLVEKARVCEHSPQPPDNRGWGTPDWREGSAYPAPDEFDDLEYRWEFLRRRHAYRLDWLRPETDFHPATRQQYFLDVYELELPCDPRLSVRDLATWMSPTARRGTDAVFRFPVSGLVPFRRALLSNLVTTIDRLDRIIPDSPTADDLFARFDLGQAIEPQLEQIANYLKALRAELTATSTRPVSAGIAGRPTSACWMPGMPARA